MVNGDRELDLPSGTFAAFRKDQSIITPFRFSEEKQYDLLQVLEETKEEHSPIWVREEGPIGKLKIAKPIFYHYRLLNPVVPLYNQTAKNIFKMSSLITVKHKHC